MTLVEVRELKAAYARACGTLRGLEARLLRESQSEVEILHSALARRVERERRTVDALERQLRSVSKIPPPRPAILRRRASEMHGSAEAAAIGGFTLVPNVVFDAVLLAPLHHRQKSVCFALLRLTHGFGRQSLRALKIASLAKFSGVAPRHVREILNELVALGIVVRRDGGVGRTAAWGIADPTQWSVATPAHGGQGSEDETPALHGQGFDARTPARGSQGTPARGSQGTPARGGQPLKETLKGKLINTDGGSAAGACEVASLADEELVAAVQPSFAAYGKRVQRWGPARRRRLRECARLVSRPGLGADRVLTALAAAPHGFVWFHRDARPGRFDPWRLFTPETVFGDGFERYAESYLEAKRSGHEAPFVTRQIAPAARAEAREVPEAAPDPEQAELALQRAQRAAVKALRARHAPRRPKPAEIAAELERVEQAQQPTARGRRR